MNKTKEFLKAIGRKNLPSMEEIKGNEVLFNAYLEVFGSNLHIN